MGFGKKQDNNGTNSSNGRIFIEAGTVAASRYILNLSVFAPIIFVVSTNRHLQTHSLVKIPPSSGPSTLANRECSTFRHPSNDVDDSGEPVTLTLSVIQE